jgi:hypothetical protein
LGAINPKGLYRICKKSLKISKMKSESVYRRRTDNTVTKRKSTKGQTTIYKTYISAKVTYVCGRRTVALMKITYLGTVNFNSRYAIGDK